MKNPRLLGLTCTDTKSAIALVLVAAAMSAAAQPRNLGLEREVRAGKMTVTQMSRVRDGDAASGRAEVQATIDKAYPLPKPCVCDGKPKSNDADKAALAEIKRKRVNEARIVFAGCMAKRGWQ